MYVSFEKIKPADVWANRIIYNNNNCISPNNDPTVLDNNDSTEKYMGIDIFHYENLHCPRHLGRLFIMMMYIALLLNGICERQYTNRVCIMTK